MKKLFYIEIAGIKIGFQCSYTYSSKICEEYKIDIQNTDFCVKVEKQEVENEKKYFPEYSDGYLESLCLFRKIAEMLPQYDCVVFHGAAITYDDQGIIFTAPSGTGKSTHIALWKKYLGDKVDIVNGDKPILSIKDGDVMVSGCPWAGKEKWHKNRTVKLKALCVLKRGKTNRILKVSAYEVLYDLMAQVYLPQNKQAAERTLEIMDYILSNIPIYVLECDVSELAVSTSFEEIMQQSYYLNKKKL